MTSADSGTMHRRELLLTLSEELGDLSASATSLQATLGEIVADAAGSAAGAQAVWHMQEIDRLQQTLADLSSVLRRAAEDEGQRHDVEQLAEAARLGALRDRLRGAARDGVAGQKAGIVAMF